jgi:hypothetical protein
MTNSYNVILSVIISVKRIVMKLKSVVMLLSLVTTMMAFNAGGSDAAFATTNTAADPIHCDKPGFPSCFSIGYKDSH